jgi:phenylalanyl-tRNA synthetase beta chain
MVAITIDKERLYAELGVPETDELLHQIVMLGAEIDDNTPTQLVLNITPNRPDMLSQQGFTRALTSFLDIKQGLRAYPVTHSKLRVTVDESVRDIRPCTSCAVVKGLALTEEKLRELIEIQEKLHITFCRQRKRAAIGVYPLDAISGNITFMALAPDKIRFQPLESETQMTAEEILRDHPKGRDYAHLLLGLPRYPVFIDAKKNILSMPPVINSHATGKVTLDTKDVFIEASGHDQNVCDQAVRIICAALADDGAQIQTVEVVTSRRSLRTPDMTPQRQEFYAYYVNQRLGTAIASDDLAPLLAKMGHGIERGRGRETFVALVPAYRTDVLHQIDIVEDVAIAFGYENFVGALPEVTSIGGESAQGRFERVVRQTMVALGLTEAKNYHLIGTEEQRDTLGADTTTATLKSSASKEYDSLRASLLPGMLLTLARNRTHEYPQAFFEIGTVFIPEPAGVREEARLCVMLAGSDFTRVRQTLDHLFAALGKSVAVVEHAHPAFMPGRCARLTHTGTGVLGEIAPSLLAAHGLTSAVAAAEITLDDLNPLLRK